MTSVPSPLPTPLCLLLLATLSASHYLADDTDGLGLRYEGIGAISGGGATSKLLMDYEPDAAARILDYLFLPNYGLSLQLLKVEIGSDTDATEGAESSHMHSAADWPGNFNRGYEWWLMKEAKKRNPALQLYGLPWGWPGFLDPNNTASSHSPDPAGAFADPAFTANYTLQWLLGAKRVHDLDITYVGQWNERAAPAPYAAALKEAVAAAGLKTTCLPGGLPHYPGNSDQPDGANCTQYAWNTTDGSRWVDEEGSWKDGRMARCLARVVNRNYVTDCHTSTIVWHLISSFYDYLPYQRCGLAVANRPWDGSYEITSPLWALAHTTQFAPVGWRYAQHHKGVHFLQGGGSMVTRISPDKKDFSIVLEKMSSRYSQCARGQNPDMNATAEAVKIVLRGSFKEAALRAGSVAVWYSDFTDGPYNHTAYNEPNPPDNKLFLRLKDITVGADGVLALPKPMRENETYTLTTLRTGSKAGGAPPAVPRPAPFPADNVSETGEYLQDFDDERVDGPARYWYTEMGAWEVQPKKKKRRSRSGNTTNTTTSTTTTTTTTTDNVMQQMSTVWPACWDPNTCSEGPTTYFGPETQAVPEKDGVNISFTIRLDQPGNFSLGPQCGWAPGPGCDFALVVSTDGHWHVGSAKGGHGGSGLDFKVGQWAQFSLVRSGTDGANSVAAYMGSKLVSNCTDAGDDDRCNTWSVAGYSLRLSLSHYISAAVDNFRIATPSAAALAVETAMDAAATTGARASSTSAPSFRCKADEDCELLGTCNEATGSCQCSPGFAGPSCGNLDLAPADASTGGRVWPSAQASATRHASSWGFSVSLDPSDGRYHGLVNVGCGATATKVTGTMIVHVAGPSPTGPFEYIGTVAPATSFNPHLTRAPNGTYVLYFRVNDIDHHPVCDGTDPSGTTAADVITKEEEEVLPRKTTVNAAVPYIPRCSPITPADANSTGCIHAGDPEKGVNMYVAWADHPAGPWRTQNVSINGQLPRGLHKSNPSSLFLPGSPPGRVLMSYRFNLDGEQVGFALADDFRGPFVHASNLAHHGGNDEDSYIWRQPDSSLHIIYHNGPHGYHAFSRGEADGYNFTRSAAVSGNAFELGVNFTNRSSVRFRRRERPEMLFGADGTPAVLFTAVETADGRSYSLAQPFLIE